jgi:hypothetical protein
MSMPSVHSKPPFLDGLFEPNSSNLLTDAVTLILCAHTVSKTFARESFGNTVTLSIP